MTADLRIFRHYLNQLVRQILGMRGHEADPVKTVNLHNLLEEPGEAYGIL